MAEIGTEGNIPIRENASIHQTEETNEEIVQPVVPKFDMHIYTSKLKQSELDDIVVEYGIPQDLRPALPPDDMNMDQLPEDKIGIYPKQLEIGG